jgi:FMN reductase
METRRITVLSAGLGVPSSSRLLADQLSAAAERQLTGAGFSVQVDVVELRDLAVDIANIAVTPVFSASYSGLFKSFIDVLDPKSLDGKAVLLGATGGTDRHQMVLDYALRPLFSYLRTRTAPTGVFAGPQDWGTTDDGGSSLSDRIDRAAGEFTRLLEGPQPGRKPAPMESLPFEQLLAGISGNG